MNETRRFRWSSLLDTCVIVAILSAINFFWFRHDPAFRSWSIHPYLLPIGLVGLFYGFREALASVILCNLVYSAHLSVAGYSWKVLLERPDLWNVVSFLLGGLLFGEAGELYQRALRHHRDRGSSLEDSLKKSTDENARLASANKELQEWVRFGDVQLTELHAAADGLFSIDESKILETVAPLALKITGADQCSLYWYDRGKKRFWRRYQAGRNGINNPVHASRDSTPFLQLRDKPRVISARDIESFSKGLRFLVAAPITNQGSLQGAVLLESLSTTRLTPYTVANFGMLSDLVNRCLENAALLKQGKAATEQKLFRERVHQEIHVSNRYNAALSLLYIDVHNYDAFRADQGPETAGTLIDQISRVVSRNKRKSDVLSYQGEGRFALLMPQTSAEKISAFVDRTKDEMRSIRLPGEDVRLPELSFQLGNSTLTQFGLRATPDAGNSESATN